MKSIVGFLKYVCKSFTTPHQLNANSLLLGGKKHFFFFLARCRECLFSYVMITVMIVALRVFLSWGRNRF